MDRSSITPLFSGLRRPRAPAATPPWPRPLPETGPAAPRLVDSLPGPECCPRAGAAVTICARVTTTDTDNDTEKLTVKASGKHKDKAKVKKQVKDKVKNKL